MKIAVVIPAYKVSRHILPLLAKIGAEVGRIYVVDDACPEQSGKLVEKECPDGRVQVLYNGKNLGVGGAVMHGYRVAVADGADVIVKIDGDGQMDPALLPVLVGPILRGEADYTKGNRFYDLAMIQKMPIVRVFGNAALSFMAKFSTGYWNIFDPNNGYTAVHSAVVGLLPLDKISRRYFFESDMLFRLNITRAVVIDVPMRAEYGDEASNLRVTRVFGEFLLKHARNFCKRLLYNYFLRDLSAASLELLVGCAFFVFGASFGIYHWVNASATATGTPAGTVMLAAMPIILGFQLILAFLNYDILAVPRNALWPLLGRLERVGS
jgi:glycosyltransferase involved in cell wall biosynthesis